MDSTFTPVGDLKKQIDAELDCSSPSADQCIRIVEPDCSSPSVNSDKKDEVNSSSFSELTINDSNKIVENKEKLES
jgi:hypothetical protein